MKYDDLEDVDDVILFLLPLTSSAWCVANMPQNMSRRYQHDQYLSPHGDILKHETGETGPSPGYTAFHDSDGIVIRFSHGCKTGLGVISGRADGTDLVLPSLKGISKYHFSFTFDEKTNMPIVRDIGSSYGTKVTYDGEQGEQLSNSDWPLPGPNFEGRHSILHISGLIKFVVVVPDRDFTSPDYIEKVKRFRVGTTEADDLLQALKLQTAQSTRVPSGQAI